MPVKKEPSGRRSVEVEVEVPGTPEEVWEAIATGAGITAWFVPTTVEKGEGGHVTSDFGPGMTSEGTIRAWEPPHRYVVETEEGPGTIATEWIVEARSGGTCTVRVVHAWFAEGDDWDDEFEGHEKGWQSFFRILRLYLTHFAGRESSLLVVMGSAETPEDEAWTHLLSRLGLAGARVGERRESPPDSPPLSGVVEIAPYDGHAELMMLLDEPAGGIAHLFAMPMGDQVLLPVRLYLYGDDAEVVVSRDQPLWERWMSDRVGSAETA